MSGKREKLKRNLTVQMNYVKDFFGKDATSSHVRYVSILAHPLTYVFASVLALILYFDYLHTDHINNISSTIAQIPEKINPFFACVLSSIMGVGAWLNAKPDLSGIKSGGCPFGGLGTTECLAIAVAITLLLLAYKFKDQIMGPK